MELLKFRGGAGDFEPNCREIMPVGIGGHHKPKTLPGTDASGVLDDHQRQ
jgi:hypothetical protein